MALRSSLERIPNLRPLSAMLFGAPSSSSSSLTWDRKDEYRAAVEVASFDGMGHGLRTTCEANAGDVLLSVPASLWERYSAHTARTKLEKDAPALIERADALDERVGLDLDSGASQHALLALHIVLSFCAGDAYVRSLPRVLHSPTFSRDYADGDYSSLPSAPLADAVKARVDFFTRVHAEMGLANSVPFPLFAWGCGTILSRAVRMKDAPYTLVPLLDFANHNSNPNAELKFSDEDRSFMLVAKAHVGKGEQAFIDYGSNANGGNPLGFLLKYGFENNIKYGDQRQQQWE